MHFKNCSIHPFFFYSFTYPQTNQLIMPKKNINNSTYFMIRLLAITKDSFIFRYYDKNLLFDTSSGIYKFVVKAFKSS